MAILLTDVFDKLRVSSNSKWTLYSRKINSILTMTVFVFLVAMIFFVANNSRFEGEEKIELIAKYPKAKGPGLSQDAILFYRVLPGGE